MRHTGCSEKIQKYGEEVKEFERQLEERHRQEQREEMQQYLEALDRKTSEELLKAGGYVSKGQRTRKILTSVGLVTVRVRCYEHKGGHRLYPLRDLCGIGSETGRARQRCVRMVVERSYGWSAGVLREEFGMKLSRMRLWKIAQEEGRRSQAALEAERTRIFEQAQDEGESPEKKPTAMIEIDGTMLASRETGERDRYGGRRMEVKLGVMFRGTRRVGKRRRRTVDRTVYARVAEVEEFGEQWYTHCRRAGLGSEEEVHVIADGAGWIRTVRQGQFPGSRYTLDLHHLKEKARAVLVEHQYEQFCQLVRVGLVQTAIEYLHRLRPSDDRHADALKEFRQYVEDNREGIHYEPGSVWGSGVAEKLVDVVIGKRMKRQGMIWSRSGANNLLALRSQQINAIAA
jgi:hypothetical protein